MHQRTYGQLRGVRGLSLGRQRFAERSAHSSGWHGTTLPNAGCEHGVSAAADIFAIRREHRPRGGVYQDTPGFAPAHLWTALGRPWPEHATYDASPPRCEICSRGSSRAPSWRPDAGNESQRHSHLPAPQATSKVADGQVSKPMPSNLAMASVEEPVATVHVGHSYQEPLI